MNRKQIKIAYIITSLDCGGAEIMLLKLTSQLALDDSYNIRVFSLLKGGVLSRKFKNSNIDVSSFGFSSGGFIDIKLFTSSIIKILRFNPNIIHSWMYHANILALMIKIIKFGRVSLIWGVRQTIYDLDLEKKMTKKLIKISAFFSKFVNCILYNSLISKSQHEKIGFSYSNAKLIPNGFNTDDVPMYKATNKVRSFLNITDKEFLIGCVARYHPMKGHKELITTFYKFKQHHKNSTLLLIGDGVDNKDIVQHIEGHSLSGSVLLFGYSDNVLEILSELDLFCLPSKWGEAFPNALGEAMSIGVPCLATNVGDVPLIMNGCGRVVGSHGCNSLLDGLLYFSRLSDDELIHSGKKCQNNIIKKYSLKVVIDQYKSLYLRFI